MQKKYYRPEINGLRALAIIPVILFHAKIIGFSGGFVGVDIFFVISGFLITSILLREMEKGDFSFSNFWERRIRRIFPALFVVLFSTLGAAYLLPLYPPDFFDFGKSLLAQGFFLSNIFFMRREGYFATPDDTSLLLHTWTLSVEEQFYILLPVLLYVIWKFFRKKLQLIVLMVGIFSFLYSIYLTNIFPGNNFSIPLSPNIWGQAINQTAGFYLLFSRIWEFVIGAIIAIFAITIKSKHVAEMLSWGGLFAIIYSITQFDSSIPFPGVAALLPTFGAAAIILSNTEISTFVGKILSFPTLVWIGLLSYSLYLWHWPVFVFSNALLYEKNILHTLILILFSFILAWLTYIFIEVPFGKKQYIPNKNTIIATGFIFLIIFCGIGYTLRYTNLSATVPNHMHKLFTAMEDVGPIYYNCFVTKKIEEYYDNGPCILGSQDKNIKVTFIVWGDSHAGTMLDTIHNLAQKNNIQGVFFGSGECMPVANISASPPKENCQNINNMALGYISENNIKNILLISRWNRYFKDNSEQFLIGKDSLETSVSESKKVFEENLKKMVYSMNKEGRNVFLQKQVPENNFDIRELYYSSLRSDTEIQIEPVSFINHEKYNQYTNKVFDDLKNNSNVKIIDPTNVLCTHEEGCMFEFNNKIIYQDSNHLNFTGANMLEPLYQDFIEQLKDN